MLVKGAMEKAALPVMYKNLEGLLKKKLEEMKYPTPLELLRRMEASGLLKIYASSPTMEMFNVKKEDLIPEVDQIGWRSDFPRSRFRCRNHITRLALRNDLKISSNTPISNFLFFQRALSLR